ncbi:hypothetical protein [Candidatus Doolittlea endobia]|uniref:Uncharacterized protein n=1 Tax=Candidatus Doolittlea endobia TaxID=1778262 RepID=A0A143WRX3_9ENTR|nr:hypothetical protein [Candidatus Doolittlea endobia]CUX96433.1 hypothetical protein MHIR_DE00083 [Candidatus Doolittlea endobia]
MINLILHSAAGVEAGRFGEDIPGIAGYSILLPARIIRPAYIKCKSVLYRFSHTLSRTVHSVFIALLLPISTAEVREKVAL